MRTRLPTAVWMLGLTSLFMDISSEMIHGLLPVFLTAVVGVSAFAVGLIEGIAEATASFMKLVSGAWSDRIGKRKPLAVVGYGLAALSKPFFPLADTAFTVLAARMLDRVGKGIRGAPRDALIADLTETGHRGAAFGLRQSLDTIGAVAGPLIAVALMVAFAGDMRAVFAVAIVPAVIAVAVLVLGVHEPASKVAPAERPRFSRASLKRLPRVFWLLMLVTAPFTLARFSEAFLILRAQSFGVAATLLPLTLVVMNVVYAASAYPAGKLADRIPRVRLLAAGCVVLVAANACLALGDHLAWTVVGTLLWGLHMGLTEGLIASLVADHSPEALRGTGFGVLHLIRGVLLLVASVLAGALWSVSGPQATFLAGAALGLLTLLALPLLPRSRKK